MNTTPGPNTTNAPPATWVLGRVIQDRGRVIVVLGEVEHVIDRGQAVALGSRLLQAGIGTTFADERAICARIGDIITEWRTSRG